MKRAGTTARSIAIGTPSARRSRARRNTLSRGLTPSIIASSGVGRNTPRSISREEATKPRERMSSVKLVSRESACSTCGGRRRTNVPAP